MTFGLFSILSALAAFRTGRWSFALGAALLSAVVIAKNYRDAKLENSARGFRHRQKKEEPRIKEF